MKVETGPSPGTVEVWYRQHAPGLVRLGALASGDVGLAEDAVQEVFAGLYRRPPVLRDPTDPLPYLRTSVLNRCRSGLRQRRTRERTVLRLVERSRTVDDVERRAVSSTTHRQVLDAVRALPRRQRDVILLRHWLHLSEIEIADTLGISPGTVKSAASRARTALAPVLEALR